MPKRKALVIGRDSNIVEMFQKMGWEAEEIDREEAANHSFNQGKETKEKFGIVHLLVFTGGEDVDPSLYGEKALALTRSNPERDAAEGKVYRMNYNIPKVGICRGGQFLNVMNNGKMWQHVNNHGRNHLLTDLVSGEVFKVTSTHHQMMRPGPLAEILAIADEATEFLNNPASGEIDRQPSDDMEVLHYRQTNSLCFQPHPEYDSDETKLYFFDLLEHVYGYKPEYVVGRYS